jgi:hypothetical protein
MATNIKAKEQRAVPSQYRVSQGVVVESAARHHERSRTSPCTLVKARDGSSAKSLLRHKLVVDALEQHTHVKYPVESHISQGKRANEHIFYQDLYTE